MRLLWGRDGRARTTSGWGSGVLTAGLLVCSFTGRAVAQPSQRSRQPSQLRVATCSPGFPPFTYRRDESDTTSKFIGYSIDQWNVIYGAAKAYATLEGPHVAELFGSEPPQIVGMSIDDLYGSIKNGSIDVALCGSYVNHERVEWADYAPTWLETGYRAVINLDPQDIGGMTVLAQAFKPPDVWATFALLFLVFLSLLYAHIIWFLERRDNIGINKDYGPGVYDAWWLSIVTALTVGYGEKVPVTHVGKMITILWMFTATYCVGFYTAAVTSQFFQSQSQVQGLTIAVKEDLVGKELGVSFNLAKQHLIDALHKEEGFSADHIKIYESADAAYQALKDNEVTAVVDDAYTAQWMTTSNSNFSDFLSPTGEKFQHQRSGILVSRPGGKVHPAHRAISLAMISYMQGESHYLYERLIAKWFGEIRESSASYSRKLTKELQGWNDTYAFVISAAFLVWVLAVSYHYRQEIFAARTKAVIMHAMGIGSKFTTEELEAGAEKLFFQMDKDGSGTLDANEIAQVLRKFDPRLDLALINAQVKTIRDEKKRALQQDSVGSVGRRFFAMDSRSNSNVSHFTHSGRSVSMKSHTSVASASKESLSELNMDEFKKLIVQMMMGELSTQKNDSVFETRPARRHHLQQVARDNNQKIRKINRKIRHKVANLMDALGINDPEFSKQKGDADSVDSSDENSNSTERQTSWRSQASGKTTDPSDQRSADPAMSPTEVADSVILPGAVPSPELKPENHPQLNMGLGSLSAAAAAQGLKLL